MRTGILQSAVAAAVALLAFGGTAGAAPASAPVRAERLSEAQDPLDQRSVTAFLRDLFGVPPVVVRPGFTMFRIDDTTDSRDPHHVLVTVTQGPGELALRFSIHDNHCVDWVREFMEGPFFTPAESEALYALLPQDLGERVAVVGRFQALARCEPAPGGRRLTLRFLSPTIR